MFAAAQLTSIPGDVAANVARHVAFARVAADHGARLVVFPELSLTGYEPTLARGAAVAPDDARLDPLRRLAADVDVTIVAGAPVLAGTALHIAALIFAGAAPPSVYTKQHLHPGEELVFTPGPGGATVRVAGRTVAIAICAEITHGEHAAQAAAAGADVYAAGVFITPTGYAADTALLAGYARAHRMVVVMANHAGPSGGFVSAGQSAIWSSHGHGHGASALVVATAGTAETLVVAEEQGGSWRGSEIPAPR